MNRTVARVFKVLAISIIMMIFMDLAFVVTDTITVNNRVNALSAVMQDELARNNCIPNEIRPLFQSQLSSIKDRSSLVTDIKWNIDSTIAYNGVTYPPINQDNYKQYGDSMHLVIQVTMQPHSLMFMKDPSKNNGSFLSKATSLQYTRTYVFDVPALRYLK